MKIGYCGKPDAAAKAAQAGFDYLELPLNMIAALPEQDFADVRGRLADTGLPTPAFNLLFPKELRLLEAECTDERIAAYLDGALSRMKALGGSVVVFGSGKSRQRPESLPYADAYRRLVQVTGVVARAAEAHDVTVVIEPLNRRESNMINSVGEGACLVADVCSAHVRLLADYYHMAVEHEPPEEIARVSGISHAHIATETGRRFPLTAEEGYRRMFAAMKATGYSGMLSIEGKTDDLSADGPAAVGLLKQLWEEA